MYAVVESGGKQHRVREGDLVRVEKVSGEVGSTFTFDRVLMVGGEEPTVGAPLVKGASVEAEIVHQEEASQELPSYVRSSAAVHAPAREGHQGELKWHIKKVKVRPETVAIQIRNIWA